MKRTKSSSQEESSSRRQPRVRCLSWEPLCLPMPLLLLMQQKRHRWDAQAHAMVHVMVVARDAAPLAQVPVLMAVEVVLQHVQEVVAIMPAKV